MSLEGHSDVSFHLHVFTRSHCDVSVVASVVVGSGVDLASFQTPDESPLEVG